MVPFPILREKTEPYCSDQSLNLGLVGDVEEQWKRVYEPFVEIFVDGEVGIADDGVCWRTRRKILFARSKACEFEDDVDATQEEESPEARKAL